MTETRYWIVVAAHTDVLAAQAGGYVEINHGKAAPLGRLHPGDGIAAYSPRVAAPKGKALQSFTALGTVGDGAIVQSAADHQPFRRPVRWLPCSHAPVKPLLDALTFVRNRSHWGAAFRFGYLRVPPDDFLRIASAMGCLSNVPVPAEAAAPHAVPLASDAADLRSPGVVAAVLPVAAGRPTRARRARITAQPSAESTS